MIGCLTETTTCVVAKPLVIMKLLTASNKLASYKQVIQKIIALIFSGIEKVYIVSAQSFRKKHLLKTLYRLVAHLD